MAKPTFYYNELSGPCRTVMIVAKILKQEFNLKTLDLFAKEQMKPEFLKINPFHCVPTLVIDDEFVLDESRVIAQYLIESLQPDHSLYPQNDLKKRSLINRWLHYDIQFGKTISTPMYSMFHGRPVDEQSIESGKETLKTLDMVMAKLNGQFLTNSDTITLADIAMYSTCNYLEILDDFYKFNDNYPNIKSWYEHVANTLKEFMGDEIDKILQKLKQFVDKKREELKKQ